MMISWEKAQETDEFNHPKVAKSANQPPITQVQPSKPPSIGNSSLFSVVCVVLDRAPVLAVVALNSPDSSSPFFAEMINVDSPSERLVSVITSFGGPA